MHNTVFKGIWVQTGAADISGGLFESLFILQLPKFIHVAKLAQNFMVLNAPVSHPEHTWLMASSFNVFFPHHPFLVCRVFFFFQANKKEKHNSIFSSLSSSLAMLPMAKFFTSAHTHTQRPKKSKNIVSPKFPP